MQTILPALNDADAELAKRFPWKRESSSAGERGTLISSYPDNTMDADFAFPTGVSQLSMPIRAKLIRSPDQSGAG